MHVRVGGEWMHAVASWGDLSWATDERGCQTVTWAGYFAPGDRHPAIRTGALVEVMDACWCIWSGFLDQPLWESGTFSAKGYSYLAGNFLALDGAGAATSTPSVAVDEAIGAGWPVSRGASIPTTPFTAAAEGSNRVSALLDSQADELGQRWSVREDRVVRMEADATAPDWHIRPGVVELGNASDDYASSIVVTYLDPGGVSSNTIRTDAEAAARFGPKQEPLDLIDLGPMTLARAEGFGDGILAKGAPRLGWTSAIEVTAEEILSPGGVPADLTMVRSGQVVRIHGLFDDLVYLDGRTYLDVVIGSTQHDLGSGSLTIGPVSSVAQTLSEAITALSEEAAK